MDERIFVALRFAAEKHKNQRRKGVGDIPYINHPVGVATLLATVGGVTDPDVLVAALLHDTVEDTETSPEEIERLFGPVVAGLVAEVTDDKKLKPKEQKATQEREAQSKSPKAKLIRLADKACNVYDIVHEPPSWSDERCLEYFDWAARVVAGLRGVNAPLEAEFDARLAHAREVVAGELVAS